MAGPVTVEYKGKIAVITLENEKKLNALDANGYYQLASYMKEIAEHDEVYITVLTGKGMSSFAPLSLLAISKANPWPGRYFSA